MIDHNRVITRIARLQAVLLDHTGHVRRDLSRAAAQTDLAEIKGLRAAVGWRPLDMTGRCPRRP
jgi:hypothetical protein